MIEVSAKVAMNSQEFTQWVAVARVIRDNLPKGMWEESFNKEGYEGLFPIVPEYFGMTRMYRGADSYIRFEFTTEQWLMFVLKWM